jgi:hypothetical protein
MRASLKLLYISFFIFTLFTVAILNAKNYTQHTFFAPSVSNFYNGIFYPTLDKQRHQAVKTSLGGTLNLTPLYKHSTDKNALGKYMGFKSSTGDIKDYISIIDSEVTYAETPEVNLALFNTRVGPDNVWAEYIIHDSARDYRQNIRDKIQFKPEEEIFSLYCAYHHNLDSIINGLYIEWTLPITKINHKLTLTRIGDYSALAINDGTLNHMSNGKTFIDYLAGNVYEMRETSCMQQAPLKCAKMVPYLSKTGLADLTTKLGYKFINKKNLFFGLNAHVIAPTAKPPMGEYIFEPILGNGHHWGTGGGIDFAWRFLKHNKTSLSLVSLITLDYLFPVTQRRTLGIKKDDGTQIPFGHYYAVGQTGVRYLTPFANVSTQALKISPGVFCEGLLSVKGKVSSCEINLGYNLFVKQKESVTLRQTWLENTYAIAHEDYKTVAPFFTHDTVVNIPTGPGEEQVFTNPNRIDKYILGKIQTKNLDMSPAITPAQFTHTLFISADYSIKWRTPITLGLGGAYTISSYNNVPSGYALWVSTGLTF